MKRLLILGLFTFSCLVFGAESKNEKYKIAKVSLCLFKSQVDEDLWLVMEKIGSREGVNSERLEFWKSFIKDVSGSHDDYKKSIYHVLVQGLFPKDEISLE